MCSNTGKVRAVGYDLADPGVIPTLELRNITVQAFYKEKISESKTTFTHNKFCACTCVYDSLLMYRNLFVW